MQISPASRARGHAAGATGSVADRTSLESAGSAPPVRGTMLAGPVVVGVNGSAGSAAALRWAADEACRRRSVLRIVSAWQPDPGHVPPGEAQRVALLRIGKALVRVFRRPRLPLQIMCATPRGWPGRALLHQADDTDLLVLGIMPAAAAPVPGPTGRYCLRYRRGPLVFVPADAAFAVLEAASE